jgi:23S rRNA (guanine745-N1)-methyltransferase
MLADVVRYLRCPVCGQPLTALPRSLACPDRHAFDLARHGYVQLTATPLTHEGDTPEMIAARADFLAGGHYDFIPTALAAAAPSAGLVVDVGAGTGRYLAAVLDALPGAVGVAVDASRAAVRQAARAHPRIGAVRCDAWRSLPLADGQADLLIDAFAPRNGAEFARVLRPGGTLLVVTPTGDHLGELVAALRLLRVDPDKEERVAANLAPWFRLAGQEVLERPLALRHAEVAALVGMGPSAWHANPGERRRSEAIAGLAEPVRVTASVRLARYHRIGQGLSQ